MNALQADLAERLGFEAALFMPSGTQNNLCALLAHCRRGDEYIDGTSLPTPTATRAACATVLGSISPNPLAQDAQGRMNLADIETAIKPDDCHFARTRLLCLENTWNGFALPWDYLQRCRRPGASAGLALHLDGARLFNAAVASTAVEKISLGCRRGASPGLFDSVSVCFSKGLGAPVGSVLCSHSIARAHRVRKMAGAACARWVCWRRRPHALHHVRRPPGR